MTEEKLYKRASKQTLISFAGLRTGDDVTASNTRWQRFVSLLSLNKTNSLFSMQNAFRSYSLNTVAKEKVVTAGAWF